MAARERKTIGDRTFQLGIRAAVAGGVGAVVLLHQLAVISLTDAVSVLVVALLFPIYLLLASIVLSLWLGHTPDERDLKPVDGDDRDPWRNWPW